MAVLHTASRRFESVFAYAQRYTYHYLTVPYRRLMTDDAQVFAHLDALWELRSQEIEAQIEQVREHIQRVHCELGSLGDSISDALQDLMVVNQAVQQTLARGVFVAHVGQN